VTIAQFGGGIGGHEHRGLGLDRWQEAIAAGRRRRVGSFWLLCRTLPGDSIVAFALGGELGIVRNLRRRLYRLREYVVVLVTANFQPPGFLSFSRRQRKCATRFFLQEAKLLAFNFATIGIKPDLPPVIARDFNNALGGLPVARSHRAL